MDGDTVAIIEDRGAACTRFRSERRARLVAPEDDMWAHLADAATAHALVIDGSLGGYCAVDDEHQLRSFHVTDRFESLASDVLAYVVDSMDLVAALPSTVDPTFLTLSLAIGGAARPVGLMYDHVVEPTSPPAVMRLARDDDHREIVAFDHEQTDSPFDFLEPYLAERIARGELAVLVDDAGRVVATGECRADTRSAGYAHLGLIVRADDRNCGVGRRVLSAMVDLARSRGLQPVCSTEPTNHAARRIIRHAGFRQRHSVLLVSMPG